jgi:hypothetical protein
MNLADADVSRETAALSKNFDDLVLEIEEHERGGRKALETDQDPASQLVKVYYITGGRQHSNWPGFERFARSLEACNNLFDRRKTEQHRSSSERSAEEAFFVTPRLDNCAKEVAVC